MRIKKITSQDRRDFTAVYECEHCGAEKTDHGYDDAHFHKTVIPNMACAACGKIASSGYRPLTTKYPDGQVL